VNWLLAFVAFSAIASIGGGYIYVTKQAKQTGRLEVEKEQAERKAADAENAAKTMAAPGRSWDAVRASLRRRKPE
jgi:hypothetical protein